uniref:WH1 domain-containing protein n=1 Tax=Ditylenchus dipsaci TaxID=166011 RepID=A0A915E1E5_9BILA
MENPLEPNFVQRFPSDHLPSCPRFISFEGDQCVFALSFSDHAEADNFKDHLQKRSEHEQKSHQREHRVNTSSHASPAQHNHHQRATPPPDQLVPTHISSRSCSTPSATQPLVLPTMREASQL